MHEKRVRISESITRLQHIRPSIGLDQLGNADATLLFALLMASEKVQSGSERDFTYQRVGRIVASQNVEFDVYDRLFQIGAIVPSIASNLDEFEYNESGNLVFDYRRINWSLGRGLRNLPYLSLCEQLEGAVERTATDYATIAELWDFVAVAECEACLLERADYYYFSNYAIGEKTVHAIKYALEKFSIPQVWSVIYSSTQYAAAQKQSRQISGRHAQNLIPGSIIGYVDRAIDGNWTTHARTRGTWHTESALTAIFFNRILASHPDGFRTITSTSIRNMRSEL